MMRTRRGKLKSRIDYELSQPKPDINNILTFIDMYERDNIKTIGKLKRKTIPNVKRINGALRQTINAHGPITKQFIGSASKRIYGALLEIKKPTYLDGLYEKILKLFK